MSDFRIPDRPKNCPKQVLVAKRGRLRIVDLMPRPSASRVILCLCVVASIAFASPADPPAWPEITSTTKAWSRWWWLGNILNERDTTAVMEQYAAAGLGGLEITPIYGVAGYEDRFLEYLSPEWVKQFGHVLSEGRRLDLGLDMATGTGWPFGGLWIEGDDTCRYLAHRTWTLAGGARLAEPVEFTQRPALRAVGSQIYELHGPVYQTPGETPGGTDGQPAQRRGARTPRIEDLVEPIAANKNLQALALDQVRFPKKLPLSALVAHSESGEVVDLTSKVSADGTLDWTAPEGRWTLYGLFSGYHGKMVERAAPGGEGNVIDHFSSRALASYLAKFDEAFAGLDLAGLRGFYNDSYEVDDAQGESDWTLDFLEQFQKRRGYDLRRHLPALFATDDSDEARRVRSDYRETVSDLLRDEFTTPWTAWAHKHKTITRSQAHGSPANILDLYAAVDIPEQEGSDVLAIKMASSAAHVTGKNLTAAEAATWLDEHFSSTLGDIRRSVDTYFLGGGNHICYHGTAYSPPADPWPGFHFYASVELNPSNSIWADFPALNAYVARAQSFLQSGKPDEDVLLYYNIHDRWARHGGLGEGPRATSGMPHFHGRAAEGVGARATAEKLRAAGYGHDLFSDRQAKSFSQRNGQIISHGQPYRALVVPVTQAMPVTTLAKLVALAESGVTIVVEGALPTDAPGLGDLAARRKEFGLLIRTIEENASTEGGVTIAPVGRGRFLIGSDVVALLSNAGVKPEKLSGTGLEFVRRSSPQAVTYFLVNRTAHPVDGWIALRTVGRSVALFDPMSGKSGIAASRPAATGGTEVYLQLPPGASMVVQVNRGVAEGAAWTYTVPSGTPLPLSGEWKLEFTAGGPELPAPIQLAAIKSWTELGGEALKAFSGTARYSIQFAKPAGDADAWQLDLGSVADSARVKLNGREIATLINAPWCVSIPAADLRAQNSLEVDVTNLATNRVAHLDRRGVSWKKFYNVNMPARRGENRDANGLFTAAKWEPRPSGLLGPVTLTSLSNLDPK